MVALASGERRHTMSMMKRCEWSPVDSMHYTVGSFEPFAFRGLSVPLGAGRGQAVAKQGAHQSPHTRHTVPSTDAAVRSDAFFFYRLQF